MVYKFDMPSYFGSWNKQFWAHDNPLRAEIEQLKEQNASMLKLLTELKNEKDSRN